LIKIKLYPHHPFILVAEERDGKPKITNVSDGGGAGRLSMTVRVRATERKRKGTWCEK
jgi:hypothetical protein